jgi:predicted lipid-binding transport protein (Tim44 family)
METENRLLEALENVRRDKHQPWRYLLFTLLNGIAQGLGVALGMTLFLGVAILILTKILASMINFPVVGYYISELMKILDAYVKQGRHIR